MEQGFPVVREHRLEESLGEVETADDSYAWLFAGPLGSGKTTAAKHAMHALDTRGVFTAMVEYSDYVRYLYEQEGPGGDDVDDNGLGRWAAEMRNANGTDYFTERLASEVGGPTPQAQHVVVSGVRSPTTPPVFEEHFDRVITVVLWALPELRFSRVSEDREAFNERNDREMEGWGCREFYLDQAQYDYVVPNNNNEEELLSLAITQIVLDEYDGSRDASVYRKAPWHVEDGTRSTEVHCL